MAFCNDQFDSVVQRRGVNMRWGSLTNKLCTIAKDPKVLGNITGGSICKIHRVTKAGGVFWQVREPRFERIAKCNRLCKRVAAESV